MYNKVMHTIYIYIYILASPWHLTTLVEALHGGTWPRQSHASGKELQGGRRCGRHRAKMTGTHKK